MWWLYTVVNAPVCAITYITLNSEFLGDLLPCHLENRIHFKLKLHFECVHENLVDIEKRNLISFLL